ncbi:MAG: radical SAM protein [Phycisphaerae bacterium]|nr:radical SAM protein [Phycisphaerae bacterium]
MAVTSAATRRAFSSHSRVWADNRYVYPVVSRRSGGLSIGINLNPDKICNFDCIYCSVDRHVNGPTGRVETAVLRAELRQMLALATSNEIFRLPEFAAIRPELMRLNDIAFSGDGEPTTCPVFGRCCRIAAEELKRAGLSGVKLVLITNATMFARRPVRKALEYLDQHGGEIWAKLDAGTAAYYQLVNRPGVGFDRICANITWCAQVRPTVIQTLLMRIHGQPPPPDEIQAYARRLADIKAAGGRIKLVQLYTVARNTAENYVDPLAPEEMKAMSERVKALLPGVPLECFW